MLISNVLPDGRSLVFINVLIQVSACVADIIRIAHSHLKWYTTHCWFPIGGLLSFSLMTAPIFQLVYTGWISFPILWLSSLSCLRTGLADLWSLNGNIILRGAFLSSHFWKDPTSPDTNFHKLHVSIFLSLFIFLRMILLIICKILFIYSLLENSLLENEINEIETSYFYLKMCFKENSYFTVFRSKRDILAVTCLTFKPEFDIF